MRKDILIIGGSGYFGNALTKKIGLERIVRTYYKNKIEDGIFFDFSKNNIIDILKIYPNIQTVVMAAGIVNFSIINQNPKKARFYNVECMKKMINELERTSIFPIYISSESVFDGKIGNYSETSTINPTFEYAIQKATIEKYIRKRIKNYQILRISKIYDSELSGKTLIANWLNKLRNNEDISCANDNIFAPIHLNDLCGMSKILIEKKSQGIFHLSSLVGLNRKKMLNIVINNCFDITKYEGKITYKSLNEFPGAELQPLNTSMNPSKAIIETGYKPRNFEYWVNLIAKSNN